MSMLVAFLLLWGLSLGPVTEAATFLETQPHLWAESESLLEPSAEVTLTCQARVRTADFQLFKNGVAQETVHLDAPAIKHQFLLTGDTWGRYRCRSGLFEGWTQLSELLELTGPESLPPPWLSVKPVSWITPGLNTTAVCRGGLRGVTFLLRQEGDHEFLEMSEAQEDVEATFPVHRAGNYSCSYQTHAAGAPSEPSNTVTIKELAAPPPPALRLHRESTQVLRPGSKVTFTCVAPLSGVQFQLRRGEKELLVPQSSTSPDRIFFHLNEVALGDAGPYTCRYQLRDNQNGWSGDSEPVELIVSNDKRLRNSEREAAGAGVHRGAHDSEPGARHARTAAVPGTPGGRALRPGARGQGRAPRAQFPEPRRDRGPLRTAQRFGDRLRQLQLRVRGPGATFQRLRAQRALGAARGRAPAPASAPGHVERGGARGPGRRPALRGARPRRRLRAAARGRDGARGPRLQPQGLGRPGADLRGAPARRQLQVPLPLLVAQPLGIGAQRPRGAPGDR
ncbi:alpha-1B-glycoprotein isoform X1 [Saimiri boliviensis]|uniref:alpha-1B-glycoprotein isoform X1 n=1 Tax=Saimiri boliviensis TaxID=27679 RepID=UPI003D7871BE